MLSPGLSQDLDTGAAVDVGQDLQVSFQALLVLFQLDDGFLLLANQVLKRASRNNHQFIPQIYAHSRDAD